MEQSIQRAITELSKQKRAHIGTDMFTAHRAAAVGLHSVFTTSFSTVLHFWDTPAVVLLTWDGMQGSL